MCSAVRLQSSEGGGSELRASKQAHACSFGCSLAHLFISFGGGGSFGSLPYFLIYNDRVLQSERTVTYQTTILPSVNWLMMVVVVNGGLKEI